MDTFSSLIFSVSAILLLLAFFYSLINRILCSVYNSESEVNDEKVEAELNNIFTNGDFKEITFQGRFVSCSVAVILLGLKLANQYWYLWIAIIIGAYIFVFFIPTILSLLFPYKTLKFSIRIYKVLKYIFMPTAKVSLSLQKMILNVFGYDSKLSFLPESMREAINDKASDLEEEEKQMIRNIFDFVDTPVREIMTPRVEMHAIDVQTSLPDVIKLLNNERHSRLPVYSNSIDNIIGILSNREFLEWYTERPHETFNLEKLVHKAFFVPMNKKIDSILHELRESNNHLAIVVDEYGGTAGLVTMEDILEEIVGEINDEDDSFEDERFVKLSTGQYILDPLITLSDLEDNLGIHFNVDENEYIDTLSGLIHHALGSIPKVGTSVQIQGYLFKIKKMKGTKIEEIVLETILPNNNS